MQDDNLHDNVENKDGDKIIERDTRFQDGRFKKERVSRGVKCVDHRQVEFEEEYVKWRQAGCRSGLDINSGPQEGVCQKEKSKTVQFQYNSGLPFFPKKCNNGEENGRRRSRNIDEGEQAQSQNEEKSKRQKHYGARWDSAGKDFKYKENQVNGECYLDHVNEVDRFPFKNDPVFVAVCDELEKNNDDVGSVPYPPRGKKRKISALSCLVPLLGKYCMPRLGRELDEEKGILKRIKNIENRLESISERIDTLVKNGRLCKKHLRKSLDNQSCKMGKRMVIRPKERECLRNRFREKPSRGVEKKTGSYSESTSNDLYCGVPLDNEFSCDIPFDEEWNSDDLSSEDVSSYCGRRSFEVESNCDDIYDGISSDDEASYDRRTCEASEESSFGNRSRKTMYSGSGVCNDTSYEGSYSKDKSVNDCKEDNPIQKCIKRISSFGSELMESLRSVTNNDVECDNDVVTTHTRSDTYSDECNIKRNEKSECSRISDDFQLKTKCKQSSDDVCAKRSLDDVCANKATSEADPETNTVQTEENVVGDASRKVREEETKNVAYSNEYQPYLIKKPDGMPRSLQRKLAALTETTGEGKT